MQLFTHLLSSYLQGMGDFFSALPRGRSSTTGPSKTLLPHPNHYTPHPNLSQGEKTSSNRLKHSRKKLPPFGRALKN